MELQIADLADQVASLTTSVRKLRARSNTRAGREPVLEPDQVAEVKRDLKTELRRKYGIIPRPVSDAGTDST